MKTSLKQTHENFFLMKLTGNRSISSDKRARWCRSIDIGNSLSTLDLKNPSGYPNNDVGRELYSLISLVSSKSTATYHVTCFKMQVNPNLSFLTKTLFWQYLTKVQWAFIQSHLRCNLDCVLGNRFNKSLLEYSFLI